MQFSNSFDVPLPPDAAWTVLMDIPRIAPCMPGAELTEQVDENTYKGKVSVRLGPVMLAFAGTATFDARNDADHTAKVRAQGTDAKGRGGASATVGFKLEPAPGGSRVLIDTDLNLSGSVAQYGRGAGMIQAVAAQLIGQFATALKAQIGDSGTPPAAPAAVGSSAAPAALGSAAAPAAVGSAAAPAAAPPPPPPVAKPIGGFSLVWQVLLMKIRGLFGGKA